jgi:hypothetical protein
MNHRDRQALQELLEKLWATRDYRVRFAGSGQMTAYQQELLAAAMRIVAGSTNGPNLPPPFVHITNPEHPDYQRNLEARIAAEENDPIIGPLVRPIAEQNAIELAEYERTNTGGIDIDPTQAAEWATAEQPRSGYVPLPRWRDRILKWIEHK